MSWTEIWINYLQPIASFIVGSGLAAIVARMSANFFSKKIFEKHNLEKTVTGVVDRIATQPVKIQIEDKMDKHLSKLTSTNENVVKEMKQIVLAQNKVFTAMADLYSDSYAVSDEKIANVKNAVAECEKVCHLEYEEKPEDTEIVVKVEPKLETKKEETTPTVKR